MELPLLFLLFLYSLFFFSLSHAGSFSRMGVNYGTLGDNLPSPVESAVLLKGLNAGATRIYDANHTIIQALAGTALYVVISVPNEDIPAIAGNFTAALDWVQNNVLPFCDATDIRFVYVGNEVLSDYFKPLWPYLLPAIRNIYSAMQFYSIFNVKVGTTVALDVLQTYSPPSAGEFRLDIAETIVRPLLNFLHEAKSYFFVDAYPYFVWSANSSTVDLDYALGVGKLRRIDPATGLTYTNLLDELLDAFLFAMRRLYHKKIRFAIAETGWPNAGDLDQVGANVHNAAIYNRHMARRTALQPGTPAWPGIKIPTFVFALYNENLKYGPGTERHWGLLYPNGSSVYENDLAGKRPEKSYPPLPPAKNNEPYQGKIWCIYDGSKGNVDPAAVAASITAACKEGTGTCDAIQPEGECYEPNTPRGHASYAFNSNWQQLRNSGGYCYFGGLAVQTTEDPSYGSCQYPSFTS